MYRWAGNEDMDRDDPRSWARLNPAVGRRMTIEFIASERAGMTDEKFDHERMGRGDYPRPEGEDWIIARRRWEVAEDRDSKIVGPMVFAPEVNWGRMSSAISVAGRRADGDMHFECIASDMGTLWVAQDLKKLIAKFPENLGVVLDPGSPTKTLIGPLRDVGIEPILLKIDDITTAWGDWYDALTSEKPTYHHTGGTVLTGAMADAQIRTLGGAVTWKRIGGENVAPIIAATWATHGVKLLEKPAAPPPPPQAVNPTGSMPSSETADLATMAF
jgi:hypothetical protein